MSRKDADAASRRGRHRENWHLIDRRYVTREHFDADQRGTPRSQRESRIALLARKVSSHADQYADEARAFGCGVDVLYHDVGVIVDDAEHTEERRLRGVTRHDPRTRSGTPGPSVTTRPAPRSTLSMSRPDVRNMSSVVRLVRTSSRTLLGPSACNAANRIADFTCALGGRYVIVNRAQFRPAVHAKWCRHSFSPTFDECTHARERYRDAVHGSRRQRGVAHEFVDPLDTTHEAREESHRGARVAAVERRRTGAKSVGGSEYVDEVTLLFQLRTELGDDERGRTHVGAR